MSLRVWLPLNGNLDNQGLDDITVTNNGATVDNSGKIGKCYSFSGSGQYLRANEKVINTEQYSISFWMYATTVSGNHCIFSTRNIISGAVNIYQLPAGIRFDTNTNATWQTGFKPTINTWYHITLVQNTTTKLLYVNGELNNSIQGVTNLSQVSSVMTIGCEHIDGASIGTYFAGKLNDFRIYNHALSAKEVKLLSQGLVAHYTLDNSNVQTLDNCYGHPTFDTTAAGGGWSHWGRSGHIGTYGQNTDKQYIFRKEQTYSHWVANGEGATGEYLCYQSPAFDGGYRSLCIIAKEENSKPITEDILFPGWNAGTGSVPSGKWTSIQDLSNGFYLCKVEGFQQTGSNDLVGVLVKPGYKVYLSEGYLENDKTVCSDIFYPSNTIYDSSGFKHDGVIWAYDTAGDIELSKDTTRYSKSTYINSANNTTNTASGTQYIYGNCELTAPDYLTAMFWCKPIAGYGSGTNQGQFCLTNSTIGSGAGADYITSPMNHRDSIIDMCTASNVHRTVSINFTAEEWHHYAVVYDGRYGKVYKDGVQTSTLDMGSVLPLSNMKGIVLGFSKAGGVWRSNKSYYSDFRLYTTPLSEDDIKELYQSAGSVDNHGNSFMYEYKEE